MSWHKNSEIKKNRMLRLIESQEQSGQSQIEFCKNQKLSIATFGYWRKKYLEEKNKSIGAHFVPLKIQSAVPRNTSIEVELPNQIILRFKDWQIENLSALIVQLYPLGKEKSSC